MDKTFSDLAEYGAVGICVALIVKEVIGDYLRSKIQTARDEEYNATIDSFNETLQKFLVVVEGLRTEMINRMPLRRREPVEEEKR